MTTAARIGAICYLDEVVEARQDTTVVIHPLTDHRRSLPLDKKGELLEAHPDFQLVISCNPGYQSLMKDLKQSTNEQVGDSDKTILQLTREAATLVSTAIEGIGDPFALRGFASDGRHDVQYYRFKDFNQHFDDEAKARLAGMKGGLSTRMGAALRHAGQPLLKQQERRKLPLLVTDGEPADTDENDPQHLRNDSKKAVEELYSNGVLTYCLTLDPHADSYVKRIFGENNYTVIEDVDRLPEQLPLLFASLTG